jgi:hypothetical protein
VRDNFGDQQPNKNGAHPKSHMSRKKTHNMKNSKFIVAVIVGSVAFFLLGYLIYGVLLDSLMKENCGLAKDVQERVFKQMPSGKPDPMFLVTIFVSNIFGALLVTIVAGWANARTLASGAKVGAILGLLFALNYDLLWYAMSNIWTPTGIAIDVCASTVMTALATAIIAMILGKGKQTA